MSVRQQRQGFRLSVKKAIDTVISLKAQVQSPEVLEKLLRKGLLLGSYLPKLEQYDKQVLETISDETEIEQEIAAAREFNEVLEETITETQPISIAFPNSGPSTNPDSNNQQNLLGDGHVRVNLPKLQIAPFEGDPLRWQEFWDAFKASIHDRHDMAIIDKFTYLRGLLAGDALKLVEGFRVTEANYKEVTDLLLQRYGDVQTVIFAHIEALLSIPQASGDAQSLANMHTTLERHLRSLDSLQPDQDMILYSVILSKLPRFLKVEAHRQKGSQVDWTLKNLRKWLGAEIRAREMGERLHRLNVGSQANTESASKVNSTARGGYKGRRTYNSAAALLSQNNELHCTFCNAAHVPENCTTYPDVDSRRAQLRDRCCICLRRGHLAKACQQRKPCRFCQRSGHHSSFCFSKFGKLRPKHDSTIRDSSRTLKPKESPYKGLSAGTTGSESSVLLTFNGKIERTVMQTAVVLLENNDSNSPVTARLFFDTGASRTFITENKRRELRLPAVEREWLSVSSFQSSRRQTSEHKVVEFGVKCRDGTVQPVKAAVVPSITCPILKAPLAAHSLPVPDWSLAEPITERTNYVGIDVLIGMDYYHSFVSSQRIRGGENLWFLSSKVGFLASGRIPAIESGAETVAVMFVKSFTNINPVDPPLLDVSKYWELEEIGMKEDQKQGFADEEAVASFSSSVKFDEGRYQVCWPWKTPTQELKDNYGLAHGRLRSLLSRLKKSPRILEQYAEVFQSQLESGIIEKVPDVATSNVIYHMPHHCVLKSGHTTTKLRIVFDASSKTSINVSSLNDCLHRGPVFLEDLCGIILRFRTHAVALTSDIEKAFLQIGLRPSERDVTRFLWVRDPMSPPIGDNIVIYRFRRVPFGIISSPFILGATVSHHLKNSGLPLANQMLRDMYVDNIINGEATVDSAIQHYRSAKRLLREASMNLREWHSNSNAVLKAIPESDKSEQLEPKVLGLQWNTENDTLRLGDVTPVDDQSPVTKRHILKTLPQVFDPCGFLAPVVVSGKLLLQDLWSMKLDWDDPVPQDVCDTWRSKILPNLIGVSKIRIPRYIGTSIPTKRQLHVFCDASARACAAAVYLRQEMHDSTARVDLLMAKSRLSPIKQKMTIPRLELVAVMLGARLLEFVSRNLSLDTEGKFVWTDSQCVLYWIRKEPVATRFIQNRLKELRKLMDVHFKYTPTASNPADLPTRGCTVEFLSTTSLWWHGPDWLKQNSQEWPMFPAPQEPGRDASETQVTTLVEMEQTTGVNHLVNEERFSSLGKLLRVTAYIIRFASNLKRPAPERNQSHLLPEEMKKALNWWMTLIQKESFPEYENESRVWPLKQYQRLGIFRDQDGILCCSGRIQMADLPWDVKHPMLLPKPGHFTELVVLHCHIQVLHAGVASTLARVREQYWILKGRTVVKRVVRNCRVCHRMNGGPFRTPSPPPLPPFRLEYSPAFTNTGLDYLGPLLIRTEDTELTKVWIVLFTCAVTRAVHLEVTEDMTTDQFLLAFRRFVAVYGPPSVVVSDNGKQFSTSSRLFRKMVRDVENSEDIHNFSLSHGINWKFIAEMSPWMGSFYERLVGIVKQSLRKSLWNARVSFTELQTVVTEVSAVVNSRPLVYVEEDVESIPLSPLHLISPSRREGCISFAPVSDPDYNPSPTLEKLSDRWRRLQSLVEEFWKGWKTQYLLSLRERHVAHRQRGTSSWAPNVGTVVQLKQNLPRGRWRLGKIQTLQTGADGEVRAATVRLASGATVRRPLKLMYPLEGDVSPIPEGIVASKPGSVDARPERKAAARARVSWQQQMTPNN